jgi:hypothetical protein|tara:strand:- start:1208 stop:1447 length:240 start_codon:yes stop_codon:yes gene_type:complete
MVEIKLKTEIHEEVLDSLTELFKSSIDHNVHPDVFMETCLSFALAYHLEFHDRESLNKLITQSKENISFSEDTEEIVFN